MDIKEFRVLIKYCFLKGKNTVEAKKWLDADFLDTAQGKSTIRDWYFKFRYGEMSTEDGERSGHPKAVVTDENKKIHKIILNYRKLKLNEIADTLKISTERVHHIIHEYLDETWLHHFTPKSNRQFSEWTSHDELALKRGKTRQSVGKVMASVFWDAHGIIFIDYLEKGRVNNSDYYVALLDRLKDEIAEKTAAFEEKESAASPRKYTVSQISENDGKNP
ncbi:hypothetical protein GWI33_005835 [Rhynchophorus ferrugineus]|uniref:Transposase n=1 Tax=Rhynchophorus ferrugineus TaxID=354439 RepID=A0A834MDF7_RHYFE|nr:hypothetical protein GWI33_005835 [Rhynchophorus ferrugineus]